MKQLAAAGIAEFELAKSVESVAERLGMTLSQAKAEVLRLVQQLNPGDFSEEGDRNNPACDVFLITRQHFVAGRFEAVSWYIKIGVNRNPPGPVLWVQSCHPAAVAPRR